MSIKAEKNQTILISDNQLLIGLGWERKESYGHAHDLDSVLIMLDENNQCKSFKDICFYKQDFRVLYDGAVVHHGDNIDGSSYGDDEVIKIKLNEIPDHIKTIIIAVSIHNAESKNQNFGQIEHAYIRIVNYEGVKDIVTYDLSENSPTSTAVEFAKLRRENNQWYFIALENGMSGGLPAVLNKYGISVKK